MFFRQFSGFFPSFGGWEYAFSERTTFFFYLPRFSIYEECEDARNFKDAFGGCIRGRRVFAGGRAQGGHRIIFIAGAGEIVAFMRIHFSSGVRMPMFVLCPYIALYMRFSCFCA